MARDDFGHALPRMRPVNEMLAKRDIDCPNSAPACDCKTGWQCVATARTRTACATTVCIDPSSGEQVASGQSPSSGVPVGAIAGPVVAVMVVLSLAVFWWLRKKKARDLEQLANLEARAKRAEQEVLSLGGMRSPGGQGSLHHRRPSTEGDGARSPHLGILMTEQNRATSPNDGSAGGRTLRVYSSASINLDPNHPSNNHSSTTPDPFSDQASELHSNDGLSFLSQSTNVIPISYVPSPTNPTGQPLSTSHAHYAGAPNRPARSADLDLGLARSANGNATTKSGIAVPSAALPDDGASYNGSRASVAPSFLSFNSTNFALESPTISTVKSGVAQRANVVQLGANGQRTYQPSLPAITSPASSRPPAVAAPAPSSFRLSPDKRKPSVSNGTTAGRSPLSNALSASTSPAREANDPFNDDREAPGTPPIDGHRRGSDAGTFGAAAGLMAPGIAPSSYSFNSRNDSDRPFSMVSSQGSFQSVAVVSSANLVRVPQPPPRPPPPSASASRQPDGGKAGDRTSSGTAFTTHSLGGDSLLGHYPFVPPSPSTLPNFPSSGSLAALPPPPRIGGGQGASGQRDTQFSLSTFDFIPPVETADAGWGQGSAQSHQQPRSSTDARSVASGTFGPGTSGGKGEAEHTGKDRPTSLDTLQIMSDLRGFDHR